MLKLFKHLTKEDFVRLLIIFIFVIGQVWLDLKTPDYMARITQLLQSEGTVLSDILISGGYMMLCVLGSILATVVVCFFVAKVATGFSAKLRSLIFEKTLSFSREEITTFSTASLITRTTNDITQLQMLVAMGTQVFLRAPIMTVWAIMKIAGKSLPLTGITAIAVVFQMSVLLIITVFAVPRFKIIQALTDDINRIVRENLTGLRVLHSFNAKEYQHKRFGKASKELMDNQLFTSRIMSLLHPAMGLTMSGLNLAIYTVGAFLISNMALNNRLQLFSDVVVFSSYAVQIIMSFMMLSFVFILYPRAAVSANRINAVLDTGLTIKDGIVTDGDESKKGEIEFINVNFKYPNAQEYILKNISFTAKQGETVAFIGSTGSGKSTLISLIPRLFDVTEGDVLVEGVNIKEYKHEALNKKLSFISQKPIIFSGTIATNIAYGIEDPDYNIIKKSAEIAQATEFIETNEDGYKAHVAQGGSNLSGGQKQRLSIARAIYKNPDIYIFDDSFSALDYKTDRKLRNALKKELKTATSLIVAQRIGTIKDADKIIVLDKGQIVGMGTHNELLKTCEVYKEIAYSQLTKEELADGK